MLTAEVIRKKALEYGADLVGIGDIRYFEGTHPQRDPRSILPDATCVIGFGFRVPRALFRTMEAQVQFFNYTQLGVKVIDEELAEVFLLKMGALIENEGYDACLQRNVSNLKIKGDHSTNPELVDTYELEHAEPVAPGKAVPDIIMDFPEAARICGLASVSCKGTPIAPELGPFVRFVFIVTNAPRSATSRSKEISATGAANAPGPVPDTRSIWKTASTPGSARSTTGGRTVPIRSRRRSS